MYLKTKGKSMGMMIVKDVFRCLCVLVFPVPKVTYHTTRTLERYNTNNHGEANSVLDSEVFKALHF
jgi:hypothetical protein